MKPVNFSRRSFLKTSGLAMGGLALGVTLPVSALAASAGSDFQPNAFVYIAPDGDITIYCGRCEMGQGISTALPSAVADEMEADWSRVTVLQGDADAKYGSQKTGGSASIRTMYIPMREAGAAAKSMLISAAATQWQISEDDCHARMHFVYNRHDDRKLAFGELAGLAATLPVPEKPLLKTRDQFNYIGKALPRHDQDEMVVGKRIYGTDTRVPGIKYGAVKHVPVYGGIIKSVDKTDALKMKGVVDVIEIPRFAHAYGSIGAVAVVADNTWTAEQALKKVKVEWELGENQVYNTREYKKQLVENVESPGEELYSRGDVDTALAAAHTRHAATYQGGHLSHSPMEPMSSLVWVQDDRCEIWASTQSPVDIQAVVGAYLDRKPEEIIVHVMMAGGAFGRKFKCDYVQEAAALSQAVKAPVQLTWSREEDTRTGYYHSVNAQHIEAGADANGKVTAWLHRAAFPTITSTFDPSSDRPGKRDLEVINNHPYGIANQRIESGLAKAHTRIGWYRSVYALFYGFAINVFTDELAHKAGIDSLEFFKNIYDNNPNPELQEQARRSKGVLELVAEKGGWDRKMPENHGLGLAVHYSFSSYVAMLVHVEVAGDEITVHRVDCAVDCGQVLNRDGAAAQQEGAVVMGLSFALYTEVNFKDGAVVNSNFHDYPVLRIKEAPEVRVHFVESDEPPTGLGEPGVPAFSPAFINAIYAASGKRYRSLPIKPLKG
jgi:isoquinoline 1-oxidoreductase beta subunit